MGVVSWNESARESEQIRPGDHIVEVSSPTTALGLNIGFTALGTSLLINDIFEGPVHDWNAVNPQHQVRVNDRIVAVSGERGNYRELIGAITCHDIAKPLPLVISRCDYDVSKKK